jgi:hypothetical protein
MIGVTAAVKGQSTIMDDADDRSIFRTFRIMHLPINGASEFLNRNFSKYGTVVNISDEWYEDKEFKMKVFTGNKYVKMKFTNEQFKRVGELYGAKLYNNRRFIIQMLGHKNCFLCGDVNHIKKDCPRKEQKCAKCKERGHVETECNAAKRLFKSNFDELVRLDEDDDGDGESIATVQNDIFNDKKDNDMMVNGKKQEIGDKNKTIVKIRGQKLNERSREHLLNQQANDRFISSTPSNNKRTTAERSPEEEKEDKKGRIDEDDAAECIYLGSISDSEDDIEENNGKI